MHLLVMCLYLVPGFTDLVPNLASLLVLLAILLPPEVKLFPDTLLGSSLLLEWLLLIATSESDFLLCLNLALSKLIEPFL